MRYRGTQLGSLQIRDETKLLMADMESCPGIWHKSVKLTMELLKKKKKSTPYRSIRFGIAEKRYAE